MTTIAMDNATDSAGILDHDPDLDEPLTEEAMFGCDPWDDEHIGRHPASMDDE